MSQSIASLRAAPAILKAGAGWRRFVLATILGATAVLALPPLPLIPALLIAFPGLMLLIETSRSAKGAFAVGWWWGFGHFSAGLYWVGYAMLVDPARFGWMIPFAVFGLGALMAFFPALAALTARLLGRPGVSRVLVLAAAWTALEWVRSWIFTGFPWNLIGSVWMPLPPMLQATSLIGTYGLGLLTVTAAAMPVTLLGRAPWRFIANVLAFGVLAALAIWGAARLPAGPAPTVPGITLRIVQGNIAQTDKWRPEMRAATLETYIGLSTRRPGQPNAVIWPETAIPFFLDQDAMARRAVAAAVPAGGLIITGVPRATPDGVSPFRIWNSLEAIDGAGNIVGVYDKVHLVPFGEYVPLRGILPIAKLTAGAVDFTPGTGLKVLNLKDLPPVSPTICYEDIFPNAVAPKDLRPSWLLNVTNDGWFGKSAGPYQHFAAARLRAVEEGLPMVRAANTGVSGIIDPFGRVVMSLPLGERGVLDGPLPDALQQSTLYARLGGGIVFLLTFAVGGLGLGLRWRGRPGCDIYQ